MGIEEQIRTALVRAQYEKLTDGRYYAYVPKGSPGGGLWATGDTREEARDELRETLKEWVSLLGPSAPDLLASAAPEAWVERKT